MPDLFDEFWKLYPRKMGKYQARIAFRKLSISEQEEVISRMPAAAKYYASKSMQYVPHASTFLNQHRWEDDFENESSGGLHDFYD